MATPLHQLKEVLFQPPYKAIIAICDIYDDANIVIESSDLNPDDLANTIVSLFSESGEMVNLLSELMATEVKNTIDETTLFRRNCMITKLLTVYSRRSGLKFLQRTLKPVIGKIPGFNIADYELDKNRNPELTDEKLQENVQNAIELCRQCVNAIVESEPNFPPGLRAVCKALHQQVKQRFPNSEYSCIGGLIFLRFICPAVISPEKSQLLPEGSLTSKHRRILVLVSKILQNISNKILTSTKEAYMQTMNTYVAEAIPIVMGFFKNLAEGQSDVELVTTPEISEDEILERMFIYYKTNINHLGEILIYGASTSKKLAEQIESEKLGYLHKYGENIVTEAWRKRWFILRGNQLLYFKDVQDSHAAGIIPLNDASVSFINKEEFTFEIETAYRCYRLKGSSVLDASSWYKAIEHVITFNNTKSLRPKTTLTKVNSCSAIEPKQKRTSTMNLPAPQKWVKPTISKTRSTTLDKDDVARRMAENATRAKPLAENKLVSTVSELSHSKSDGELDVSSGSNSVNTRGAPRGRGIRGGGIPPSVRGINPNRGGVRGVPPAVRSRGKPRGVAPRARGNVRGTSSSSFRGVRPANRGFPVQIIKRNSLPSDVEKSDNSKIEGSKLVTQPSIKVEEPEEQKEKNTVWNRTTNSHNVASARRQRLILDAEHRTSPPRTTAIEGKLMRRSFEKHTWEEFKFLVSDMTLFQHNLRTDEQEDSMLLRGTTIANITTGSANCFELRRDNRRMVLQAVSKADCQRWVSRLSEETKKKGIFRATKFNMLRDGDTISVWVELSENLLEIFEIHADSNQLLQEISISEVVIRLLDGGDGFAVNDEKNSVSLITSEPQEIKAWTTEIKCAKLNFWKRKKEENAVKEQNTNTSPNQPNRTVQTLFSRQVSSSKGVIQGPSIEETSALAAESGFLLKMEKDRKTWNRTWTALYKGTLWCYRIDISPKPVSRVDLNSLHIKTFDIDSDDFQFEIFSSTNSEASTLFEAADALDLHVWTSGIKKQILRFSAEGHNAYTSEGRKEPEIVHNGFLSIINEENDGKKPRYWFSIANHTLSWYKEQSSKNPIDELPLRFCSMKQLPDQTIQIKSSNSEKPMILQVTETEPNPEKWPKKLLASKNNYWRNNKMLSSAVEGFTNRGYVLRLEGKRWIRRWCIAIHNVLLLFKSPKEPSPLYEMELDSNCSVTHAESRENRLRIEIASDDRVLQLETSSTKNLGVWLKTLNRMKSLRKRTSIDENDATNLELALRNPEKEGFLMKQGVTRKSWKRRWFVLHYPTLYYFSSSQINPGEQVGTISLVNSQIIIKVQDGTFTHSVQFQIETRQRIFFLRADTEEDVLSWVEQIYLSRLNWYNSTLSPILSPRNMQGEYDRRGYLIKKGRTNKVWKKRWFTLSSNLLTYYRSNSDVQPAGTVVLSPDSTVTIADESIRKKFCFIVSTRYRNYFLQAQDQYEMVTWIESIKFRSKGEENSTAQTSESLRLFNSLCDILALIDNIRRDTL